jgi:hypothetical protein
VRRGFGLLRYLSSYDNPRRNAAHERVSNELATVIKGLTGHKDLAELELKKYTDAERQKDVKQYFHNQLSSLSHLLSVSPSEQIVDPKPGSRAQSGGSSAPRSLLSMHLALLATNAEWGDTPLFPFVVDTLQQSGQDDTDLRRMIDVLGRAAGYQHQLILEVERLPDNVLLGDFEVVRFSTKGSALSEEEFKDVSGRLEPPMTKLRDSLRPKVEVDV